MAGIKHATQTAKPDDSTYDVSADEWNEEHTIDDNSIPFAKLSGTIANAQTPNTLLLDGSRAMTGNLEVPSDWGISCPDENTGILFAVDGSVRIVGSSLAASPMKPFRCEPLYATTWFGMGNPSYIRALSSYDRHLYFESRKSGGGWRTCAILYGATDATSNDSRFAILRAGDITGLAGKTLDFPLFKVSGVAGVDGSFTTVDGKTVTVTKGLITSIV